MEEIVRIVESGEKFSADDAAAIEKVRAELGASWCHRCDYCQPCPQKISISGVLTVQSLIKRMPFKRAYSIGAQNMVTAHNCTKCRKCVGRCPYNLNIPELIPEKIAVWEKYLAENQ